MLIHIEALLTAAQLAEARHAIDGAEWVDGRFTAGPVAARAKNNQEVRGDHPAARTVGAIVFAGLGASPRFATTALPLKVSPPTINRYRSGGETYGNHVDSAMLRAADQSLSVRTDLAATVFLTPPEDYDGGELAIEDIYGTHSVKLPAGDMILYSASSIHRVTPVTRGVRVGAFFWIQSLIRDDAQRALLMQLDAATQQFYRAVPDNPGIVALNGLYHNLLRMWTES